MYWSRMPSFHCCWELTGYCVHTQTQTLQTSTVLNQQTALLCLTTGGSSEKWGKWGEDWAPHGTRLQLQKRSCRKSGYCWTFITYFFHFSTPWKKNNKLLHTRAHFWGPSKQFLSAQSLSSPPAYRCGQFPQIHSGFIAQTAAAATARELISQTNHFIVRSSGNRYKCIIGAEYINCMVQLLNDRASRQPATSNLLEQHRMPWQLPTD